MRNHSLAQFSAGRVILLAMASTIVIGTALLSLPVARTKEIPLLDLFFTATSATCVTGLFTTSLESFTSFGHFIIMLLIQIGGLGIITLTFFLVSLFFDLGLAGQLMAGQLLELESRKNIKKLLFFIMSVTAFFETAGAISFFTVFIKEYPWPRALFLAFFHSISFFCNAGITLFNNSLQIYDHNYTMLLTTSLLMLVGGLGFLTLYEIVQYFSLIHTKKGHTFSLQSKIILYGTTVSISISALLIWLLEHQNSFIKMNAPLAIMSSLFHAISFRSTGLLTVSLSELQLATILLLIVICFIGSAPGSTGSGIRITTFTIYLGVLEAAIAAHTAVNISGRRISKDQVNKAIAIFSLAMFTVTFTTFCLLITEKNWAFIDIILESVSSLSNLGLTTGITPYLTFIGKIFIITHMIAGRIGSLTIILALKKIAMRKKPTESSEIIYPEERIMLS